MKSYVPPYKYELDVITPAINRNVYREPIIVDDGSTYIECVTSRKYENPEYGDAFLGGEFPEGTTTVEGVPTAASIKVFYRAPGMHFDGLQAAETHSGDDGTWFVGGLYSHLRYDVVARLEGRNDVIVSNVQAARIDVITLEGEFTNNEDFNGVDGEILITSGLPPFTATVIQPLPFGLGPAINGRTLTIIGTSDDVGVWESVVRVTASNGVWVDVPVWVEIQEPSDPHFDKVSLLLHMDGADGSTVFIDSSPSPKTVTPHGDAKISTAESKFGGTSAYFDGVGDYLTAKTDISNTQSWTGECWFKVPNLLSGSTFHTFFGRYPMAFLPGRWYFGVGANGRLRLWHAPSALDANVAIANDGAWHHAAVVVDRTLSEARIYLDGVCVGASAIPTFHLYGEILVGTYNPENNTEALKGYLQDVRLTMGVARYTANFTPPDKPFPNR
jgi:hypothetical protein